MAASDEKPGSHPGIERLLAVAMSGDCRGRAAVQLVDEALKCPGLYLYHELLHCPSLQNLQGGENERYYNVLRLFAYGTYQDYKQTPEAFPTLEPVHLKKLKALSIISMAETNKVLQYDDMLRALDIDNILALEDILIECIYNGVLGGKLNQRDRCFNIHFASVRDIDDDDLQRMASKLSSWLSSSSSLLLELNGEIERCSEQYKATTERNAQFTAKVDAAISACLNQPGDSESIDRQVAISDLNEAVERLHSTYL